MVKLAPKQNFKSLDADEIKSPVSLNILFKFIDVNSLKLSIFSLLTSRLVLPSQAMVQDIHR